MLGLREAEHEESAPDASTLVVSRLSCSLAGVTQLIRLVPNTLVAATYGQAAVTESFTCNFGLNPLYQDQFLAGELQFVGFDEADEVRIVELPSHPFYVATLFLPQLNSSPAHPHPLIVAYLRAAAH